MKPAWRAGKILLLAASGGKATPALAQAMPDAAGRNNENTAVEKLTQPVPVR